MDSILSEQWLWIIIGALLMVFVLPLMFIWVILNLPPEMKVAATFAIIVGWGIAAGYKDWIISKREEERQKSK